MWRALTAHLMPLKGSIENVTRSVIWDMCSTYGHSFSAVLTVYGSNREDEGFPKLCSSLRFPSFSSILHSLQPLTQVENTYWTTLLLFRLHLAAFLLCLPLWCFSPSGGFCVWMLMNLGCERLNMWVCVCVCVLMHKPIVEYFHDWEVAVRSVNLRFLGVAPVCIWKHFWKLRQRKPFCNGIPNQAHVNN